MILGLLTSWWLYTEPAGQGISCFHRIPCSSPFVQELSFCEWYPILCWAVYGNWLPVTQLFIVMSVMLELTFFFCRKLSYCRQNNCSRDSIGTVRILKYAFLYTVFLIKYLYKGRFKMYVICVLVVCIRCNIFMYRCSLFKISEKLRFVLTVWKYTLLNVEKCAVYCLFCSWKHGGCQCI